MNQHLNFNKLFNDSKIMLSQGRSYAYIEKRMKDLQLDKSLEHELLHLIKKEWHKRRSKNGTLMVVIGLILLLAGFVSCVIMHSNGSNSMDIPLYGITSAGAICLIIGLYLIFS